MEKIGSSHPLLNLRNDTYVIGKGLSPEVARTVCVRLVSDLHGEHVADLGDEDEGVRESAQDQVLRYNPAAVRGTALLPARWCDTAADLEIDD